MPSMEGKVFICRSSHDLRKAVIFFIRASAFSGSSIIAMRNSVEPIR